MNGNSLWKLDQNCKHWEKIRSNPENWEKLIENKLRIVDRSGESYRVRGADVWLYIFVCLFVFVFRCVYWLLCVVYLLRRHSWKQIHQNIPSLHSPKVMVFGSLHFLLIPVLIKCLYFYYYFWPLVHHFSLHKSIN